jgi:hypothetical protein
LGGASVVCGPEGRQKKKPWENNAHLRQLANKSTCVHFFFLVRFWAFLGKGSPVGGGWVRGQKRTRVRFVFPYMFGGVFELPSPRNAQKRDKQNREKIGFGFLVECLVKKIRHDFFCTTLCSVFEVPSLRNTGDRDKTKKVQGELTSKILSVFLGGVFDMEFL